MSITGWRSRGYLPHCDERGLVQHVVFGLQDGFRTPPPNIEDPSKRALWADREFDRAHGSRLLAQSRHAETVQDCLFFGDGQRYALAAWCIMPTHVHVLVEPLNGNGLADILQKWKSVSAHIINKTAGRSGPLWQREYFDRFMRSAQQFEWTVAYIENNPVAAGLAAEALDWPFSSASWRRIDAGEGAGGPDLPQTPALHSRAFVMRPAREALLAFAPCWSPRSHARPSSSPARPTPRSRR